MESEDKRRPHPSGHENHGGHVCHRCGWTFPNPHPSAKHRRVHRKHCGKIDGFKLIAKASDDELSDEDHREKPEEMKPEQEMEEKESSERIGEGGFGVGKVPPASGSREVSPFSSNSAADKTLEPYNRPDANKIQGLDVQSVADQLENGTQLENNALNCSTSMGTTTEHEEASSCTNLEELLLDCSVEKTGDTSAQNAVATSVIVDFTDVGDNAKTSAVMDVPTVSILPGDLATDSLERDLKSHKMDEHTENDVTSDIRNAVDTEVTDVPDEASVKMKALDSKASLRQGKQMGVAGQDSQTELFSCTEAKDIPDEASVKMKALDSKASLPQGKQMDAEGPYSQSEMFSCTGSCPVEINAGENLDASSDAVQIENFTDMVDNCIVKGNVKENLTALSVLSNIPMGEASEMEHGLCKDHEPLEPNLSLIYVGVEAGKEPDHMGGTALQSEIISKKLYQSADAMPSNMQLLHKETGNRTEIDGLNDNLNVNYGHDNAEGSSFVEDVECGADVSIAKLNVHVCLESDGMERHPHPTTRESSGPQAIALPEPVSGPCDYVAPIRLDVESEYPFEGQDTCYNSLNEVTSENHVEVADDDCAVSDAISRASEAAKISNSNQHLICEDTRVTNSDVVVYYRQEVSTVESCQPDTKVESEPRSYASESELTSDKNNGKNELEKFEQLTASTVHGSVLGLENMDIDSGHLKKSGPCSDKLNLQNDIEERAIEPAVGNDTDHPVTQTEVQTELIEIESSVTKQPLENLELKVQTRNLQNISGLYLEEIDHQNDLQGTSVEPAVGDDTYHPVTHTGVQVKHIERESSPDEQSHEERKLNVSDEVGLCHHDAQNFRLQEHTTPLRDPQASPLISVTLDNSSTGDISEVVPSGACDQTLQEGGDRVACRQQSDAALVVINASRDSNSQTDSLEGQWGSVSDGAVPSPTHGSLKLNTEATPAISDQTPKDQRAPNLATEVAFVENETDNMDLFEVPSFMTLVEPAMQPASIEIQSMQNPHQPSSPPPQAESHIVHESQGKNKNVEIIDKAVKWDSGKLHTPLKALLAEAGFQSKQKATNTDDQNTPPPAKKDWGSKMASDHPTEPACNRSDHKEWNSPARLPATKDAKRKIKGKSTWVPFLCCSYVT